MTANRHFFSEAGSEAVVRCQALTSIFKFEIHLYLSEMFKMSFLRWRTESALKKNKALRASIPYRQAQNIGIIFTVEDRQKHDLIKDMVKHFEQDGKKVKVLEFLPKKKENYEFLFDFFTIDNLNFWGKIESDQAAQFSSTPFDYLFYVDSQSNPLLLNLLAQSKARCRVGKYNEAEHPFYELMIEEKNGTRSLVDNMYKYTKQLK